MDAQGPFAHLSSATQKRLHGILTVELPQAFEYKRVIETTTGVDSEIGRNNLVDALAHLSVLADSSLDETDQASQLAKIEEHLRRALIEHPEEVVRLRYGAIRPKWEKYEELCFPLRDAGRLDSCPTHESIDSTRLRIDRLLNEARSRKAKETRWKDAVEAAGFAEEAATLARQLDEDLSRCIGTAEALILRDERDEAGAARAIELRKTETRRYIWTFGIGVAGLVVAVVAIVVAIILG